MYNYIFISRLELNVKGKLSDNFQFCFCCQWKLCNVCQTFILYHIKSQVNTCALLKAYYWNSLLSYDRVSQPQLKPIPVIQHWTPPAGVAK